MRRQDNLDEETRSEIGSMGGQAVSRDRGHMAKIGKKGGRARGKKRMERKQDEPMLSDFDYDAM